MREFKDMLRQIMDEKQLKAVDVCRMTGLGSGAISQYLSGARKPKVETIRQIAYCKNTRRERKRASGKWKCPQSGGCFRWDLRRADDRAVYQPDTCRPPIRRQTI